MTFRKRLIVVMILALLALGAYGTASYYSTALIAYVVEQALMQKLPDGADPELFHSRLQSTLAGMPDQAKMTKLLQMSQYMEKVQKLSQVELEALLAGNDLPPVASPN
jgi:hypothetical protein